MDSGKQRMTESGLTDFRAWTRDEIDHPIRQAGLLPK